MLQISHLTKSFGEKKAVDDLSLHIAPGEISGFIGHNGAGKTTTLKSMEETIKLIHDNGLTCKVVVGGAVLTPEYAEKIGADFYAKDAKETVDIAKQVIG